MKRRMSTIASLAAVIIVLIAAPASAGTVPDKVDPHVDVTDVVFNQGTDGTAWVDLTLAGPWGDGSWVDHVFSAFISVDVSNATDYSGLIVQHHDGEWTVAGTYDAGGTTAETEPALFILADGEIRLNMGTLTADDLFFTVQSASMQTPDATRIEGRQFAGGVNWANPDLDPRLRAFASFNFPSGSFQAIEKPLLPATGDPTPVDAPTDQPAEQPTTPASTAAPLSNDDSQALADDLDARAQDDLPAPKDDEGGSNAVRNFLIVAVLVAFSMALGWKLWRRNRGQSEPADGDRPIDELSNEIPSDDEIRAKIKAADQKLVDDLGIKLDTAPEKTPPDLPGDLPTEPPEDPDDFVDRVL